MFDGKKKLIAVTAAVAVLLASGAAYGAYAMSAADGSSGARTDAYRGFHDASLRMGCDVVTPPAGMRCAPATEAPELTCEEAGACATPTAEPELTCEQANACATPATECFGNICFTPPVPKVTCPPGANCSAPAPSLYLCQRGEGLLISCTQPPAPCPLGPAVEGDSAPSVAPACPTRPPCGPPLPVPGGSEQSQSMPVCPPVCLEAPSGVPEAAPMCPPPPCGVPAPMQGLGAEHGATPACPPPPCVEAPAPPASPQATVVPQCVSPCAAPRQAEPGGPTTSPGCPEPVRPDCAISSDGAIACPGATPIEGTGSGTAGAATAEPGIIKPMMPEYAPR